MSTSLNATNDSNTNNTQNQQSQSNSPEQSASPHTEQVKQYYQMQQDLMFHQSYNEFQQVIPNLYIGGQVSSMNLTRLRQCNISRVLKVNGVESNFPFHKYGVELRILDLDDMPDFDIDPFLAEANKFIHGSLSKNEGCLVVCTAGISRSASIVISYLMTHHKMRYEEAYEVTKKARIFIKPNPGFERTLKALSTKLHCELCNLTQQTPWLTQYTKYQLKPAFLSTQTDEIKSPQQKQKFQVLICDQCDVPMLVYTESHKQILTQEELLEAQAICEQVGNDYYGRDQWFIEGKQRTISDHFHWHIRHVKDQYLSTNLAVLRCKKVQMGDSIIEKDIIQHNNQCNGSSSSSSCSISGINISQTVALDRVKSECEKQIIQIILAQKQSKSNEITREHIKIEEKTVQIIDSQSQNRNQTQQSQQVLTYKVKSILRLWIEERFSIEQQIISNEKLIAKRYVRGVIDLKCDKNHHEQFIAKL